MADTSQVQLRYIKEVTWGTTPATPAWQNMRVTSFDLQPTKESVQSQELRSDRQIPDQIQVGQGASGSADFELSFASFDTFLAAAIGSAEFTGVDNHDYDEDLTDDSEIISNGTTAASFSLEEQIPHEGADYYMRYTGMRVDTLSLNITPGAIVTGSLAFQGKVAATDTAIVAGSSIVAANTNQVMNAVSHVTAIDEGGASIGTVTSMQLQIANNLRVQRAIGTLGASGIGYGQIAVSGTAEIYFESVALVDKVINHTSSSFKVEFTDDAGNLYAFIIPKIYYGQPSKPISGNNQDVMLSLPFNAVLGGADSKTVQIVKQIGA